MLNEHGLFPFQMVISQDHLVKIEGLTQKGLVFSAILPSGNLTQPLKMTIEMVVFPIENGDFPELC